MGGPKNCFFHFPKRKKTVISLTFAHQGTHKVEIPLCCHHSLGSENSFHFTRSLDNKNIVFQSALILFVFETALPIQKIQQIIF
jgi:hypothetical protein